MFTPNSCFLTFNGQDPNSRTAEPIHNLSELNLWCTLASVAGERLHHSRSKRHRLVPCSCYQQRVLSVIKLSRSGPSTPSRVGKLVYLPDLRPRYGCKLVPNYSPPEYRNIPDFMCLARSALPRFLERQEPHPLLALTWACWSDIRFIGLLTLVIDQLQTSQCRWTGVHRPRVLYRVDDDNPSL